MSEFVYFDPNGVNPDRLMEAGEPFPIGVKGRYVLIRIRNKAGRVTVMRAAVTYDEADKSMQRRTARQ